jgi:hypothetical protein
MIVEGGMIKGEMASEDEMAKSAKNAVTPHMELGYAKD